jgi:hypothetical protein
MYFLPMLPQLPAPCLLHNKGAALHKLEHYDQAIEYHDIAKIRQKI